MNEFGITKIMDGIFISDLSLIHDFEFLVSNKVSHIIMWTASQDYINFQESGIKMLKFNKNGTEGSLPEQTELLTVFDFVEESKQQFLCCLVCSDFQSEAGMLLSSYLIKKYSWDLQTVFKYIGLRFVDFSPRVEIVEQLQDFQLHLQINQPNLKLKTIQFTYEFLQLYQTDDFDEKFLLNTIKNTTLGKVSWSQQKKAAPKRRKRLQWFDRIRPSSSVGSFNCKFTIYNRNSSLKQKSKIPDKEPIKSNSFKFTQSLKPRIQQKKRPQIANFGQFFMDDLEFQSLKQLTRCKVTESRLKGSLRKSSSLKLIKTENSNKQNKHSQIQKIYNNDLITLKKTDQKNILKSLKNLSKLKLGLNA